MIPINVSPQSATFDPGYAACPDAFDHKVWIADARSLYAAGDFENEEGWPVGQKLRFVIWTCGAFWLSVAGSIVTGFR